MERESKLRAIVRSAPKAESKESNDANTSTAQMANTIRDSDEKKSDSKNEEGPESSNEYKSESKESVGSSELDAAAKKRSKSGRPSMPMWALTEDKAAEVTTAVEEDELDDLLEFAKNLGA